MNYMTPEKCVNFNINTHPSLYAAGGYEQSKLRIYDHIFNVIENGIRDTSEYNERMRDRRKGVHAPPAKYLNGERLYYGYTRTKKYGEGDTAFEFPDHDSSLNEVFTEAEQADHPEIKYWVGFDVVRPFVPYPNFQKEYSTVWQIDRKILTPEWIDEIIWFYKKCEEFFDGPDADMYHRAIPNDPEKRHARVDSQDKYLAKYFNDSIPVEESWAQITRDYLVEYRGDTLDFLLRRWDEEHTKIRLFIKQTIDMLEGCK